MEPIDVINAYRNKDIILPDLQQYFDFKPIITEDGTTEDANLSFRTKLTVYIDCLRCKI